MEGETATPESPSPLIDLAISGRPSGIPGVWCFGEFDVERAYAGDYVATVKVKSKLTKVVSTQVLPIRSVGANSNPRSGSSTYFFALDDRFRCFGAFVCLWFDGMPRPETPAPPEPTPSFVKDDDGVLRLDGHSIPFADPPEFDPQ